MENAANKLLETASHRTMHAVGFSRASAQASAVLTDLLARYVSLAALTCAKYAQHAGRTTVSFTDALEALDEMGFSLEDLIGYMREGKELSRYALYSGRRVEELHELRAHLGRRVREDSFPLKFQEYDGQEEDEGMEVDMEEMDSDDEPPWKRQRTMDWEGHIPDFLPPFPATEVPDSPRAESPPPMHPMGTTGALGLQMTALSTSAADYLEQVPYDESTLADVPAWHLPGTAPAAPPKLPAAPTQTTEFALYKAFHHILKNPQRTPGQATPMRHRVVVALLTYTQLIPRWDLPDSMYASSSHAPPRAWPIVPTFAIPTSDSVAPRRFPASSRIVAAPDRLVPVVGAQGSRLPDLARRVLPPQIYSRVTRLVHPPVLSRGPRMLTYGYPAPAPWNSFEDKSSINDKDREPPRLPDAQLYMTWEYDAKDFRAPLRRPRGSTTANSSSAQPQNSKRSSRVIV
ncbi:BTP domain-containing protein [Mycena indigotica]|uniref:BTP domain-containing protein n=1 Tax=Mycena indigotica TaxID=2126181 RepID=A0A8H6SCS8_9AGAR|nr:BTP domain-containing protein [Mycena indigotica]KAF7297171.1 BTP domain-containing protein [Mycena indigotica]